MLSFAADAMWRQNMPSRSANAGLRSVRHGRLPITPNERSDRAEQRTTRRSAQAPAESTSITIAPIEQPIQRIKSWWLWSVSALCAGGVCGLGLAVWASFSGKALLHQVGVQASYICSLGLILWRMAEIFQRRISAATSEIQGIAGLGEEQGRQLRITVASLRQQLGFERQQRARTAKEIAELRSHSSTSSRAGQALQQQMARLKKERADLEMKHQHTIATLQQKLKQANADLAEQRDTAAADAAAAAAEAAAAAAAPAARAAELEEQAAALQADLRATGVREREAAAAAAAAAAARVDADRRAEAAEAAVAELQTQLARAVAAREEGVEAARRKVEAAGRAAESLRGELEGVRRDSRGLQLQVEGIASLEARAEAAEQGRLDAVAELAALQDAAALAAEQSSTDLGRLRAEVDAAASALTASGDHAADLEARIAELTEQARAAEARAETLGEELRATEEQSTQHAAQAEQLREALSGEMAEVSEEVVRLREELKAAHADAAEKAERVQATEGALQVAEAARQVSAAAAEAARGEQRAADDAGAALGRVAGMILLALQATEKRSAVSEEQSAALRGRLEASEAHLHNLHQAIELHADGSDTLVLPDAPAGSDADGAVMQLRAALQGLLDSRAEVGGRVEALQARCAQLGATNEELKISNQGLLFEVDSHGVLIMELKSKLEALPENGANASDAAVAQWLEGIQPALNDAVQDIQEKKMFLENAKELCETLKSDVSALRQLSEDTFAESDPAFADALSQAVEEQEAMRAEYEAARRELSAAAASAHNAAAAAEAARTAAQEAAANSAARLAEVRGELAAVEAERQQLKTELQEQIEAGERRVTALQADVEAAEAQSGEAAARGRREAAAAREQLEALREAYATLDGMRGMLQEQLEVTQEQLCQERTRVTELEDAVSQARQDARAATADLLEPGIDGLVAKLHDAEAQTASLQQQLRAAQAGAAGAADSAAQQQLRAEVAHLRAVNGDLSAQHRTLKADMHHAAGIQDQLRGDVAKLLRELEDARTATAAATAAPGLAAAGELGEEQAEGAAAASDAAQQQAVRQAVEAIAERLRADGAAADSAEVVHAQAERILSQSQTIEDLNDLLSKRQREVRRMRAQVEAVLRVPQQGVTLKQLAAKAALAERLQRQLDALAARNEALRRDVARAAAAHSGVRSRTRQRLQTLAAAFGMGKLFGKAEPAGHGGGHISSSDEDVSGGAEEQMRQQSGLEIDLRSGAVSPTSANQR
eukprot:jgi/Ulvmu1/4928/UM203_0007.1